MRQRKSTMVELVEELEKLENPHPLVAEMIRGDTKNIYEKDQSVLYSYKDIDELLAAGWIVD